MSGRSGRGRGFRIGLGIAALALIASTQARAASEARSAASYSIDFEIVAEGIPPLRGSVIVDEGRTGSVSYEETTIRLVPTRLKGDTVKIQAEVVRTHEGERKVLSRPSLITHLNQTAEISEKIGRPARVVKVKITPKLR